MPRPDVGALLNSFAWACDMPGLTDVTPIVLAMLPWLFE